MRTAGRAPDTRTFSRGFAAMLIGAAGFVGPSGARNVRTGRDLGAEPVVLHMIYARPACALLSRGASTPGCA
ncbi:hypothetical protein [Nocardia sp. NPDC003963]